MKIISSKKVNWLLQYQMPYWWKGFGAIPCGVTAFGLGGTGWHMNFANRSEENAQMDAIGCSFGLNVCTWKVAISLTSKLTGSKTQLSKHPPGGWQPRLCSHLREDGGWRWGLPGGHLEGSFPHPSKKHLECIWAFGAPHRRGPRPACWAKYFRRIAFDVYSLV